MLLCLGKKEFPVDTNVGRICARWVQHVAADVNGIVCLLFVAPLTWLSVALVLD
jgi:hypothetical protein